MDEKKPTLAGKVVRDVRVYADFIIIEFTDDTMIHVRGEGGSASVIPCYIIPAVPSKVIPL
jgi:hypothetical protein